MAPLGRGVRSGSGGVRLVFQPPVEFIVRQSGRFRHYLEDLDSLWGRFKPLMQSLEERMWETDGFGTWPPLAESTVLQKGSAEILVDSGDLRDSLVDPGRAARTTSKTMEWGTDADFAHWHQEGGTIEGRPPERQVIPDPFPVEERRKFEREMVSYVNDAARRTWGVI